MGLSTTQTVPLLQDVDDNLAVKDAYGWDAKDVLRVLKRIETAVTTRFAEVTIYKVNKGNCFCNLLVLFRLVGVCWSACLLCTYKLPHQLKY